MQRDHPIETRGGGEDTSVAAVTAANVFVLIIAPGYLIK